MQSWDAYLTTAGLGLGCFLVSILTWRDGRGRATGPELWAWANGAFLAAVLVPPGTPVWGVRMALVNVSAVLHLVGFVRLTGFPAKWPLVPLFTLAVGLAVGSALVFDRSPQGHLLTSSLFDVVLLVGGLGHAALGKRLPGAASLPLFPLVTLTVVGAVRFGISLGWNATGYWLFGDTSYLFMLLTTLATVTVTLYELRVVNHRLLNHIGGLDDELDEAKQAILRTLAEVIDNSSHETAGHVVRVGQFTEILARAKGIPAEQIPLLVEAAHLHDIGKVGIPDTILDKPGSLSPEEFQIMKTHSARGHEILARSDTPLFRLAARIAWEHHENWDGTGYPRGLVGTGISLEGRMVALCDVFDALSHRRVYKEPWPVDQIFGFLQSERGRKFDPALVDLVFAHQDQFRAVLHNSNQEPEVVVVPPKP